jgi:hypothetical protein
MTNNKFKNYIIERLDEAEEYIHLAFLYLKKLEEINPKDSKLQEAIWDLCEAGEIVSISSIEIECLDDNDKI